MSGAMKADLLLGGSPAGSASGRVTVGLIDDHVAMREGLEVLLERRGCRVVASAGSAAEGAEACRRELPEVAVVDVNLPDESGQRLVSELLSADPKLGVVIYTGTEDPTILADALVSGARSVVLKPGSLSELVDAIRAVRRGEAYIDPRVAAVVEDPAAPEAVLTSREREVFDLLATGLNGEEIAKRLFISPETVRTHVRNAMSKLHARTKTEAVVQALEREEIRRQPRGKAGGK